MLCGGSGSVGILAAAFAGLVSFLSPCVLPLVPGYLSAVAGVTPADLPGAPTRRVLGPSLLFVLTFSAIFVVVFGLPASALTTALNDHRDVVEKVSGILIILLGLLFVASTRFVALNRELHVPGLIRRAGRGGPVLAGAAFAIAWTPCVGPTLGAIINLGLASGSRVHTVVLLAVYSAGLAIPFLLTAVFFGYMTSAFARVKRHYGVVILVGGALLVAMGILILTGSFTTLSQQLSGVNLVSC
jgi:cytochrome c-type biogenesis protein